jgi:regulator of sigma E protease
MAIDFNVFSGIGNVLFFLLLLTSLVFVHELGHFLAARFFNIHVEEFGIGFPPRAVGFVRDHEGKWRTFFGGKIPPPEELGGPRTIYSINWLPIGGFIRPAGEDNPAVPNGLANASKTARLVVLAAGSVFNLIFALLVFTVAFRLGWPDRVTVSDIVPDSPAAVSGLRQEDVFLTANGAAVHYPQQISRIVYANLGRPVEFVVERGDQSLTLRVTPRTEWPEGQGPMGIGMGRAMVTDYSWPEAIGRAAREMYFQLEEMVLLPGRLLRGEMPAEAARPIGIVGMNDLTAAAVETAREINQLFPVLQLIGLISVALGITNLLPLPALDGGRILFVLLEAVRGKRIDPAREGLVHLVGMVMLLTLMVIITYQDIVNPIIPR